MSISLEDLGGRIVDLDSHLMLRQEDLAGILGPVMMEELQKFIAAVIPSLARSEIVKNQEKAVDADAPDRIWNVKGWAAYGAWDAEDRVRALDILGLERQLVFPTGMWPAQLSDRPEAFVAVGRYNDYVREWAHAGAGRLAPSALLNTMKVDGALIEARRAIDAGAFALQFACNRPPAGLSPAAPEWEPLWSMIAESGLPMLFHTGGQHGVIHPGWAPPLPHLQARPRPGGDRAEAFGPWHMEWTHLGAELFLTAMILGGVLERHPDLRIGVIELGAGWVGPWCERLDAATELFARRMSASLPLKPSEYTARQVRVTPFYGERVARFVELYGLEDVYVFSTDYPHPEGGVDPINYFFEELTPLGPKILEKFFVTNGEWLLSAR
jgi:uncharacterized protein